MSMPRKARQLALKSAFVARANELVVVQNFDGLFKAAPQAGNDNIEQPKTRAMFETLKVLGVADKMVLIVLDRMVPGAQQVERAARNIPNVKVVDQTNLNVKDLAYCQALLVTEQVLAELENRFKNCGSQKTCHKSGEHTVEKESCKCNSTDGVARAKQAANAAAEAVKKGKAEAKEISTQESAPAESAGDA